MTLFTRCQPAQTAASPDFSDIRTCAVHSTGAASRVLPVTGRQGDSAGQCRMMQWETSCRDFPWRALLACELHGSRKEGWVETSCCDLVRDTCNSHIRRARRRLRSADAAAAAVAAGSGAQLAERRRLTYGTPPPPGANHRRCCRRRRDRDSGAQLAAAAAAAAAWKSATSASGSAARSAAPQSEITTGALVAPLLEPRPSRRASVSKPASTCVCVCCVRWLCVCFNCVCCVHVGAEALEEGECIKTCLNLLLCV